MRAHEAWIPMADGVRLAATIYLPDGPLGARFPALLEYLPYRKDDGLLERDHDLYAFMTARGYAGARVDIRGTGRSQGRPPDGEYTEREQLDALEVIRWLAAQPWCTGRVGMWGISWGGFNAIQVALRRPPALRAIVAIHASDDLFHDDVHYVDGIMHLDEYELMIDLLTALSPAPEFPLDEETLALRFDHPPWLPTWLAHQRDGPFWRRGSLAPRYGRLRVPALLIGGWYDGYRDSVPRVLRGARAPVRALVGPWDHSFPHRARPGPSIEWREEAVRWWERWLGGGEVGSDDPALAVFVRHSHPPGDRVSEVPGEWRWEEGWPPAGARDVALFPGSGGELLRRRGREEVHRLPYVPSAGSEAGLWWGDLAPDQAPAPGTALVYESPPLDRPVTVLGLPRALLRAAADAPLAHWFVRVADVAPDGAATLVTGGGLNGAHRQSAARPAALDPGEEYDLTVPLRFTSWVFPPGHRVRLIVSNALWPMAWPTPYPMTTTLRVGGRRASRLLLPTVPADPPSGRPPPAFPPPAPPASPPGVSSSGGILPLRWTVRRRGRRVTHRWAGREAAVFPWGREEFRERMAHAVADDRPERASARGVAEARVALPGRRLLWRGLLEVESDREAFRYRYRRELEADGRRVREREWEAAFPRDHQ